MAIQPVTKEYLVLHFEEFSAVDHDRVDALNETALLFVDEGVFGTKARYALALMVAHMLKTSAMSGVGGPIQSQSVGDISESFAVPQIKSSLQSTAYGQEYLRIARQKSVCARPLFIS